MAALDVDVVVNGHTKQGRSSQDDVAYEYLCRLEEAKK